MSEHITSNKLKIIDDKTHIIVMTSGRPWAVEESKKVVLRTPTFLVTSSKQEKLLGCIIQDDCKCSYQIPDCKENNLVGVLNQRIGAVKKVCKLTSFQQRKFFRNGIFMSKVNYCITVWGSCSAELQRSLQVCQSQNRAAKLITRNDSCKNV